VHALQHCHQLCSREALSGAKLRVRRVGQNRICTPYMAVCMVISLLKIPYIHCIYVLYVWFWPILRMWAESQQCDGQGCGSDWGAR